MRIYEDVIASLHEPGGDVYKETTNFVKKVQARARILVPKRSYRLRDSHGHTVYTANKYRVRGVVFNTAPHAEFVHGGTQGPITARGFSRIRPGQPKKLRLRAGGKRGARYGVLFRSSVSGQSGQPWLEEAAVEVTSEYL